MEEERKMRTFDLKEMTLKCSSKGEVYKVLTIIGAMFLPPVAQVYSGFIRDLFWGDKLVRLVLMCVVRSLK